MRVNMFRRGGAMTNVIVVIVCVVAVFAIMTVLTRNTGSKGRQTRDQAQLRWIHQSFAVMSREFNGTYPLPSQFGAVAGPEDIAKNTTANLFSVCIMQNYLSPDQSVGPTEPSSHVKVLGDDGDEYDWASYSPANDVLWDTGFKADLHDVSHVSYAHVPLFGELKEKHWRATLTAGSNEPLLGNRGPAGGVPDSRSITNRIHAPHDRWSGFIVDGSGAVTFTETFPTRPHQPWFVLAPESLPGGAGGQPATDAAITFTKAISADHVVAQHD